ncbi:sensor histidine kinase [Dyella nitratireducens]|uniref:Histidine kinase n=1 Tax=Dyella nitratireducens TaxID=1849580 RepID=A0ABQ1GE95_9GAMM|nr:sensor histidine kinase [Dyella nitratireducens]GGA42053.1 histidine kinase [Dyella nitratireducens]GLQ42056.1 histidine kinase [Dyella nitratireducens]
MIVPLSSQTPYRLQLSQLQHRAYLSRDGAPAGGTAIAQTADGFLWFASQNGLYRFDGVHFDGSVTRQLPTTNIYSLYAEPNGDLWIGYTFGGAGVLHDGKVSNIPASELPSGSVIGFARAADKVLWIATTRGVLRQAGSHWKTAGPSQGYPGHHPQWFGTLNGQIYLFDDDSAYLLDQHDNQFHPVDFLQAKHELIGFPPGVTWSKNNPYWASLRDPSGALWVTRGDQEGIARMRWNDGGSSPSSEEHFDRRDGLTGQFVFGYFMDRESNVWVTTESGIDRFSIGKFTPIHFAEPFPNGVINITVAADAHGGVWVGSAREVALYIKGDQQPVRTDGFGLGADCSTVDSRGVVWMPGRTDIETYDGTHVGHIPPPSGTMIEDHGEQAVQACQGIAEDAAGDVWISFLKVGVFRLSNGTWTPNGGLKGLPKGPAIRVLADESGRIWLTYPNNRIAVVDHDHVKLYTTADGLNIGNILAIAVRGTHVWATGDHGLAYLSPSGNFISLLGKSDNHFPGASGVVETPTGELWLNGPDGVYRISADEIAKWLKQPNYAPSYELFTQADGIDGVAVPIRPGPTMIESADGRIWVTTKQHLSWIDPAHIRRNTLAPDVMIGALEAGRASWPASSVPSLPPMTHGIHITYTAPALSMPERVHFRYRLKGVDSDWQDDGGRREAFYTNMQPGSYHFEVFAVNEDGVASRQPATLNFTIMPAFYQTLWFKVLMACAAVLVLWLLYMLRLQFIERRYRLLMEERVSERERIARDLHDTLLQGMQGMLLQVGILSNSRDLPDAQRTRISKIEEKMRSVLIEGRDAINALRQKEAGRADLREELEIMGHDAAMHSSTHFSLRIDGEPRPIDPKVGEETMAIARESIINAFKHAEAEWVRVSVYYKPDALIVDVTDNGLGITEQKIQQRQKEGHWGVAGMRERASKLGGQLVIRGTNPQGTTVALTLPASVAYADYSSFKRRRSLGRMFWR